MSLGMKLFQTPSPPSKGATQCLKQSGCGGAGWPDVQKNETQLPSPYYTQKHFKHPPWL